MIVMGRFNGGKVVRVVLVSESFDSRELPPKFFLHTTHRPHTDRSALRDLASALQ